jgi:hypothetical protein
MLTAPKGPTNSTNPLSNKLNTVLYEKKNTLFNKLTTKSLFMYKYFLFINIKSCLSHNMEPIKE